MHFPLPDGSPLARLLLADLHLAASRNLSPLLLSPPARPGDGYISMEELDAGLKPKTRRKIEMLHEGGWKFDKAAWDASVARHNKWNMADVFKGFDTDGDGKLTMKEMYRAFRAMGLPKRDGSKMEVDKAMFDSFDTNGDGFVTLVEFQEGLLPKTRKKIEMKLESGWTFDKAKWDESVERHKGDA